MTVRKTLKEKRLVCSNKRLVLDKNTKRCRRRKSPGRPKASRTRKSPTRKSVGRPSKKTTRSRPRKSPKKASRSRRPVRIKISKDGALSSLGYSSNNSERSRHIALNKAIKDYGYISVIRKLNALAVLNKNKNPRLSKIFRDDQRWVSAKRIG